MKTLKMTTAIAIAAGVMTAYAAPAQSAPFYLEEFPNAGGNNASFSDVGWNVYLVNDSGGVTDRSDKNTPPAAVAPAEYGFTAPRVTNNSDNFDDADGPGLMFTTEPGTVDVALLDTLSVAINADGNDTGDEALGRLAFRIGSQWYASDATHTSDTNDGPGGIFFDFSITSGFTNGANWRTMTATAGGTNDTETTGSLSVSGSTVGGTLSGDIDAFGVYAENGNDGDHFRIDDFEITIIPEPASLALVGLGSMLILGGRRRRD